MKARCVCKFRFLLIQINNSKEKISSIQDRRTHIHLAVKEYYILNVFLSFTLYSAKYIITSVQNTYIYVFSTALFSASFDNVYHNISKQIIIINNVNILRDEGDRKMAAVSPSACATDSLLLLQHQMETPTSYKFSYIERRR